jgi:hypothetical protein
VEVCLLAFSFSFGGLSLAFGLFTRSFDLGDDFLFFALPTFFFPLFSSSEEEEEEEEDLDDSDDESSVKLTCLAYQLS